MNQAAQLALVALLSALGTFIVIRQGKTSKHGVTEYRSRAQFQHAPSGDRFRPPIPYQQPLHAGIGSQRWYDYPVHGYNAPSYRQTVPKSLSAGREQFLATSREGKDCSHDIYVCGTGYYCCEGICLRAKQRHFKYLADDAGALWICMQHGYKKVSSTSKYNEYGYYPSDQNYVWVPCTYAYLNVYNNPGGQGGTSILMYMYESGHVNTKGTVPTGAQWGLVTTSQLGKEGEWYSVNRFTEVEHVHEYSELLKAGAYPVKNSKNPYNSSFTFRFNPCS